MKRTEEERDKLCSDLYEGETSKKFMLHLVRAYAKLDKIKKVQNFREKQRKRCVVCDTKLLSIKDVIAIIDQVSENAAGMLAQHVEGLAPKESPMAKYYKGQTLAYEGDGTDTCVCVECAMAISRFTIKMLAANDKDVSRTVRIMQENESGIQRKPRIQHSNVPAANMLCDAPGFSDLVRKFKK